MITRLRASATALGLWLAITATAQTNYDDPSRWAIDAQFGMGQPLISHNGLTGPGYFSGPLRSTGGTVGKLRAELYMPNTHFSLKGGYEHERLHILSGDAETEFSELSVGARWYPAPWIWQVQPFVGLDGYVSLGGLSSHAAMSSYGGYGSYAAVGSSEGDGSYAAMTSSEGYQRTIDIRNPRFSVAPVVGADIYLFSHIALQLEYAFRLGIDSRMTATSTFDRMPGEQFRTKSSLHRHAFTVGLKVVFPFSFTPNDGETFFEGLLDALFGD